MLISLSSCASLPESKLSALFDDGKPMAGESEEVDSYLLGPDDVIQIFVENHPEWSGDFSVKPDGSIMIRDLGEVDVEGLTKTQLKGELEAALEEFLKNPRVTVDIVRYASQAVYVLGEVQRPGRYLTEGKALTLRDAIMLSGLPTRFANESSVFIISPSRKTPKRQVVNLYRVLYRGELKWNVEVKPGDIVYVPQNIWGRMGSFFGLILSPLTDLGALNTAITATNAMATYTVP